MALVKPFDRTLYGIVLPPKPGSWISEVATTSRARNFEILAKFPPDIIETGPYGPAYGREAVQQRYADLFQRFHPGSHLNTIEKMYMLGDNVVAIQRWSTDKFKGWVTLVFVPKGDDWLVQLATWNFADFTPPPATPSPTATPK